MEAVHFGAGNIGRGFIGETLAANGFKINFVDVNETIIDALNQRGEYTITLAAPGEGKIHVENVDGINNGKDPEAVVKAIAQADLVTTAIGPKILPFIAPLIAQGIEARQAAGSKAPIDVVACENMIGGSQFLKEQVYDKLADGAKAYADEYIGFPNAAVDRIVPIQHHDDPLAVSVEDFKEWVIDESQMKNAAVKLDSVHYVPDLEPYIERKLFSVNTGHATTAYTGKYLGYTTIGDAVKDEKVLKQAEGALAETRSLLLAEFSNFTEDDLAKYQASVVNRFKNPYISDDISRVARTPIRKLGFNERFIRPIRELKAHNLSYKTLLDTVGMIFRYDEPNDDESVKLQALLKEKPLVDVIKEVTSLKDEDLIAEIKASVESK
ncbi:mannitol-1-phosphate 5-dehydrogenase [Lacticaseibacillus baoqingensis]|uniref:Mannitol-1-phosphate 5-dehydrogenase n=1 Tax=Lacticaseibacillus baoqingensis TaxID=2486013 RepID=A0ABW4E7E4_9LACO|nr:mannitol-1-phosphate 5-dehydrogenase [Lacticaseibacillus baoqingensis]